MNVGGHCEDGGNEDGKRAGGGGAAGRCAGGPDRGCEEGVVEEAVGGGDAELAAKPGRGTGVSAVSGFRASRLCFADSSLAILAPAVPWLPLREVWVAKRNAASCGNRTANRT